MSKLRITQELLAKAKTIKGKRSRIVVEHLLKHGAITTEDLERYGYKHPPRAIRDVREQGLPLTMYWTTNQAGKKIAGYRFGDFAEIRNDRAGGRTLFSKQFRKEVIQGHQSQCAICHTGFDDRYFQIDHRIPYEVAGETNANHRLAQAYMPLCGSCNRAKSWSCEHCENWRVAKDPSACQTCYWANPIVYQHVALREMRRLDLVWDKSEVADYDAVSIAAATQNEPLPDFVKKVLRRGMNQG